MTGERVVVVGASAAGVAAAEALRREGHAGSVTLLGDEAALPYNRPPLSKQVLSLGWGLREIAIRSPQELTALGIDLRLGAAAVGVDPDRRVVLTADGTALRYDVLVAATGVRPRHMPTISARPGVHVLRTFDDASALRDRLAKGDRLLVVGAGFLGSEIAAAATKGGTQVTVVEPAGAPMVAVVGPEVAATLAALHREHGVDLRLGVGVAGLAAPGRRQGEPLIVELSDGTVVQADDVVVAVGCVPNTEWLEGAGVQLQDGVLCDEYLSAGPGIYAAGDVARWTNPVFGMSMRIEHRTNAAEQGIAVAKRIVHGEATPAFAPVPYFWSDQYDVKLHAFGHLRGHDKMLVIQGSLAAYQFVVAYCRQDRIVGVLAAGLPVKALRTWPTQIRNGAMWADLVAGAGV